MAITDSLDQAESYLGRLANSLAQTESLIGRLGKIASGTSLVVGAVFGIWQYVDDSEDAAIRAKDKIAVYEQESITEARINVQSVVHEVYKQSSSYMPSDCTGDRSTWPEACHEGRRRWMEAFVSRMNSEARRDVILIVQHFNDAIDCSRRGSCDEDAIMSYYGAKIREFWEMTFAYLEHESDFNQSYAWLVQSCRSEPPESFCREQQSRA